MGDLEMLTEPIVLTDAERRLPIEASGRLAGRISLGKTTVCDVAGLDVPGSREVSKAPEELPLDLRRVDL